MRLAFLRHVETAWNRDRRLQGRANVPASPDAIAASRSRRLPARIANDVALCVSSPLARAVVTAQTIWPGRISMEPNLIEMDFGAWEGATLADLRRTDPAGMAAQEARGLDMQPPGGESPRQVRARLAEWILRRPADTALVVTHKGVIRAAMSLATGWDFTGRQPIKLDWQTLHIFELAPDGRFSLVEPNVALVPAEPVP